MKSRSCEKQEGCKCKCQGEKRHVQPHKQKIRSTGSTGNGLGRHMTLKIDPELKTQACRRHLTVWRAGDLQRNSYYGTHSCLSFSLCSCLSLILHHSGGSVFSRTVKFTSNKWRLLSLAHGKEKKEDLCNISIVSLQESLCRGWLPGCSYLVAKVLSEQILVSSCVVAKVSSVIGCLRWLFTGTRVKEPNPSK